MKKKIWNNKSVFCVILSSLGGKHMEGKYFSTHLSYLYMKEKICIYLYICSILNYVNHCKAIEQWIYCVMLLYTENIQKKEENLLS